MTGGIAGIDEKLTIAEGQITLVVRGHVGGRTAPISQNEIGRLTELVAAVKLPPLKLAFRPNHVMDALSETLTVVVGEGKKRKRYRVIKTGAQASDGYRAIVTYLRRLQDEKFSST